MLKYSRSMTRKLFKMLLPLTICAITPISCVACNNKTEFSISLDVDAWLERCGHMGALQYEEQEFVENNLRVNVHMWFLPYKSDVFPLIDKIEYHLKSDAESSWTQTDKFDHTVYEGARTFIFYVDIYYNQIVQELKPGQKIDGFKLYFC